MASLDEEVPLANDSPTGITMNGSPIFPVSQRSSDDILDSEWAKIAFMTPDMEIDDDADVANRYWSSAEAKFTDSRLGCNIGINTRPQWGRYIDLRVKGRRRDRNDVSLTNVSGNYGMGRAYSDGIDNPAQRIYMRFGVPKFNSLLGFLNRAFDREMTVMARTGRAPSAWFKIAEKVGTAITLINFPLLTITVEAGKAMSWLMGNSTSRFFTLKPTMHHYWSMVNTMVNAHAVNTGIYKRVLAEDGNRQRLGSPYKLDEEQIGMMAKMMPDIFNGHGFLDIYALANRAQRMANFQFEQDYQRLNQGEATNFEGYLKRDTTGNGRHSSYISDDKGKPTLAAFLNHILSAGDYSGDNYYTMADLSEDGKDDKAVSSMQENDPRVNLADPKGDQQTTGGYIESLKRYADAEWADGSQFAIFRVDNTGSVSEAWGNTVAESDLQQKLNQISSTAREARFSLAEGNITGTMLDDIGKAVVDTGMGLLNGVTLGFAGLIPGLGGSGYVDIPKHWQSSSVTLPQGSYTMQLISPYNNPISRMINIWIPFFMALASGIPRSTGKQSYTHPFYCQLYDRGRLQSRLAMVQQIRVTRGTSNLAFDLRGQALALDITLDVVDLSSIMHMPMSTGGILDTDMSMDDDNLAQDYLAVLAGMDIYSQIYAWPKAQLKATKALLNMKQKAMSPAFHASLFKNSVEDGFINTITLGASGLFSDAIGGLKKGNAALEGASRDAG